MYEISSRVDTAGGERHLECTVPLPVPPAVAFDAVATGEGITSWFITCALEPHVGGRIVQFHEPGAPDSDSSPEAVAEALLTASVGEITDYTPPTAGAPGRFAYEERDWMGEDVPVPPWVTVCEVRDDEGGSILTLRSGFASDGTLAEETVDGSETGWRHALVVLAHRLTHRPADGVVTVDAGTAPVGERLLDLWARVQGRLVAPSAGVGAAGPVSGTAVGAVARCGEVGGIVAAASEGSLTVMLSAPVDGVLEISAYPAGETPEEATTHAALRARVYEYVDVPGGSGEPLGAAAIDAEPTWDTGRWQAWLDGLLRGTD